MGMGTGRRNTNQLVSEHTILIQSTRLLTIPPSFWAKNLLAIWHYSLLPSLLAVQFPRPPCEVLAVMILNKGDAASAATDAAVRRTVTAISDIIY